MGYRSTPLERLSSTSSGRSPYIFVPIPFRFSPPPPSPPSSSSLASPFALFTPRAKLLMNIGPKYQSTGDPAEGRSMLVGAYVRILPGVYTPRFPSCQPRAACLPLSRVHGHARLSRVNSSSFPGPPCNSRTSRPLRSSPPPAPSMPPSSCPLDENLPRGTICPLPSSRSQDAGAHDIPSHENLIANPAETPGCKSFRELTSTAHENYAREHERETTTDRKFRAGVFYFSQYTRAIIKNSRDARYTFDLPRGGSISNFKRSSNFNSKFVIFLSKFLYGKYLCVLDLFTI